MEQLLNAGDDSLAHPLQVARGRSWREFLKYFGEWERRLSEVALHVHHDEGGVARFNLDWHAILGGDYGNDLVVFVHHWPRSRKSSGGALRLRINLGTLFQAFLLLFLHS